MELFIFSGGWDKVIFENGEGKIFQKYNLSESEKSPINFFQKTILDKKRGKSKLQVPTSAWGRAKNRWKNFPGVKTRVLSAFAQALCQHLELMWGDLQACRT